jgi:eukaryotic-like serine/threonine-protein kinase
VTGIEHDEPTEALVDGRYRLGEVVGEGAMARVHRADDLVLERTVALKMMRSDQAVVTEARARSEMLALSNLSHDGLVTLYDARIAPGATPYLVMEFVDGPTLAQRLTDGPLTDAEFRRLAEDLTAALVAVHAARIVHRDVKPSNVLLAHGDAPGRPFRAKLGDFGIAHLMDASRLTVPGVVMGTAAYLAPEQLRGAAPAPPADVYALGLLFYEALVGSRPHALSTGAEAALVRLTTPIAVPDTVEPRWRDLVERMLRIDPAERPTAADISAEVAGARPSRVATVPNPAPRPAPAASLAATRELAPVAAHRASASVRARSRVGEAPVRPRHRRTLPWLMLAGAILLVGLANAWAIAGWPAVWSGDRPVDEAVTVVEPTPVTDGGEPADDNVDVPAPAAPEVETVSDPAAPEVETVSDPAPVAETPTEPGDREAAKDAAHAERDAAKAQRDAERVAAEQARAAEKLAAEQAREAEKRARDEAREAGKPDRAGERGPSD